MGQGAQVQSSSCGKDIKDHTFNKPRSFGAAVVGQAPKPFTNLVAAVQARPSLLEPMEQRIMMKQKAAITPPEPLETLLVSSPGFGVLDPGCGRPIIGEKTLQEFERLWKAAGLASTSLPLRKWSD